MKKKVFLTGGGGCVGRAILAELTPRIDFVCLTKDEADRQIVARFQPLAVASGDIGDSVLLESLFRKHRFDAVIHLAAVVHRPHEEETEYHRVNVAATEALADIAQRQEVSHFLFASTVSVYGGTAGQTLDEAAPCCPIGPYGVSKLEAERALMAKAHLPVTILRLATVYGAGDRGNIGRLLRLVRGRLVPLVDGGHPRKSLLYSGNLAQLVSKALFHERAIGEVFNATDDRDYSIVEIIDILERVSGFRALKIPVSSRILRVVGALPMPRLRLLAEMGAKIGTATCYSSAKARLRLNYRPEFDLESGLREVLANEKL